MKSHVTLTVAAVLMGLIGVDVARADSKWSLQFGSPIWACLVQCSNPPNGDLTACLEACGRANDREDGSAADTADQLRCQASLMRAEAAQLSCQAGCMANADADSADVAACKASCDGRYDRKVALIRSTARCAVLPGQ